MKSKIFKFTSLFILSIMVSLCLPMLFKLNKRIEEVTAAGAVVENTVDSSLILEAGAVINNPKGTAAGTATGYNRFLLNEENVTLTATANDGYKVVGWQIVLKEQEDDTNFLSGSGTIQTKNGEDVDVTVAYSDEIRTNCYKTSTFTLNKVFEDMVVTPVFDFMYYHLDITDLADEIKLPSNFFSPNASVTVYYSLKTENIPEDGIDKYDGVIAKLNSDYYYCGTVYAEGTSFYTLHNNQKIDIFANNGAFRIGDEISADFEINTNAAHIDLRDVKNSESITFTKTLTEGTGLTDSFNFTTEVKHDEDFVNTIQIEYDLLYKVTIKIMVDNSVGYVVDKYELTDEPTIYCYGGEFYKEEGSARIPVDTTEETLIGNGYSKIPDVTINYTEMLKVAYGGSAESAAARVVVSGAYSKIDNFNYYVKDSSSLRVECKETYSEKVRADTYEYFSFSTFNEEDPNNYANNKYKTFTSIFSDCDINVKYITNKKTIRYVSGVNNGGEFDALGSLKTIEEESVPIGAIKSLDESSAESNTGYYLLGYKVLNSAYSVNETLDVKIKRICPNDLTVQVWYAPIEYSIIVKDINIVSLKTDPTDESSANVYAISSLSFKGVIKTNDDKDQTNISIGKAYIGDLVSVGLNLNDGFNATLDLNNFTITKEWIEDNSSMIALDEDKRTGTITLTATERTKTYIINYSVAVEEGVEFDNLFKNSENNYFVLSEVRITDTSGLTGGTEVEIGGENYNKYTNVSADGKVFDVLYAKDSKHYIVNSVNVVSIDIGDGSESVVSFEGANVSLYSNVKANIILAEILAEVNGEVQGVVSDVIDEGDGETKIGEQITLNLKHYDRVSLCSLANEDRYFFKKFNIGNLSLSGSEYSQNNKVGRKYNFEVGSDLDVSVSYSLKEVSLTLKDDEGAISGATIKYKEDESDTIKGSLADGYDVEQGREVEITIEPKFGFILVGVELTNNGTTVSDGANFVGNVITLRVQNGRQELSLEFSLIEYSITVKQVVPDGVDDVEDKTFNGLTVKSATIRFIKPEGLYVSAATGGATEENIGNSSVYDTDLKESLETIIPDGETSGEITLTYAWYTYLVEVVRPAGFDTVPLPTIFLDGVECGAGTCEITEVKYGTKVEVCLNEDDIPLGIKHNGWKVNGGTTISGEKYTINELDFNCEITVDLSTIEYKIVLSGAEEGLGSPTKSKDKISFGETLSIAPTAAKGFKCGGVYLASYSEYEYNEDTWAEDKLQVYVLSGTDESDYYELNRGEYDSSKTYYVRNTEDYKVEELETSNWEIPANKQIIIGNYYYVEYVIDYVLKEFTLSFSSEIGAGGKLYYEESETNLKITTNQYASYSVSAKYTQSEAAVENINSDTKFNFYNTITVTIQINTQAMNVDGSVFDLTKGLELPSLVNVCGEEFGPVKDEGVAGKYTLTFNVVDIIDNVNGNNLEIKFSYKVVTKTLTLKTNITKEDFYDGINDKAFFQIKEGYGGSEKDTNSSKSAGVSSILQFLKESKIDYELNRYASDFKIESFNVEKGAQKILVTEQNYNSFKSILNEWGVYPIWNAVDNVTLLPVHEGLDYINVRYIENLNITLNVQPIMIFEGERAEVNVVDGKYVFYKDFKVDVNESTGSVKAAKQSFTINNGLTRTTDIHIVPGVYKVEVYYKLKDTAVPFIKLTEENAPSQVGEYELNIKIINDGSDFSWLQDGKIELPFKVYLEILPIEIGVSYNIDALKAKGISKTYNGNSEFINVKDKDGLATDKNDICSLLIFNVGEVNVSYAKLLGIASEGIEDNINLTLATSDINLVISITTQDGEENAINASENALYNLQINGLQLNNADTRKCFTIRAENTSLLLKSVCKINKKGLLLDISKATVNNKIYDATNIATFTEDSKFGLIGLVEGDVTKVKIDPEKLELLFDESSIGANKTVTINPQKALVDELGNYSISSSEVTGKTIYPQSKSVEVEGYGVISVVNRRGVVDPSKVALIPIEAELKVEIIKPDSGEFVKIYPSIEKDISRTNVFVVGYKLSFVIDGEEKPISSDLHLVLPYVDDLTKVLLLVEDSSKSINYAIEKDGVVIDLTSTDGKFDAFILTKHEPLLKLWQILLISIGGVAIIGGAVTTFVVIRIRRKRKLEEKETI